MPATATVPRPVTYAALRRGLAAVSTAVSRLPCFACKRAGRNVAVAGHVWDAEQQEHESCVLPMCRGCRASLCSHVLRLSREGRIRDGAPLFMPSDLGPGESAA
jgi:hypothetical protein